MVNISFLLPIIDTSVCRNGEIGWSATGVQFFFIKIDDLSLRNTGGRKSDKVRKGWVKCDKKIPRIVEETEIHLLHKF